MDNEQALARPRDQQSPKQARESGGGLRLRRRLARNKLGIVGFFIVGGLVLAAVLAPVIAPYDPEKATYDVLRPPGGKYLLGSDDVGRDLLSRLLFGLRISLLVGLVASIVAIAIGIVIGAAAGYYGGKLDWLLSGLIDLSLSFPILVIGMVLGAFVPVTPSVLAIVLGALSWMRIARLVRVQFYTLKERDFVRAARVSGAKDARIMLRHILPNAISPVIVAATLLVGWAVLMESLLSYLGFGVQLPTPTLGNMLQNAQEHITRAPWLAVFPGVLIALAVMGINFMGDGLRDVLDPYSVD